MTDTTLDADIGAPTEEKTEKTPSTAARLLRYSAGKLVGLLLAVLVGVYLTILIANMGGFVDEMRRGFIREQVSIAIFADESAEIKALTNEERLQLIEERVATFEKRLGLDQPFLIRSFYYLKDAITLNLGRATVMVSDKGSSQVRLIILERLPPTLALWGVANLMLFFSSLLIALFLSRRYGSFIDRAIIALAPTSSAPAWFYGLFLILIFSAIFQVLPFGSMVAAPPPEDPWLYLLSVGEHLILPVSAILISGIFVGAYNWRTFFLIYSSEDYVEMAKAKGLSDREIERRYVLRPTLPTIITNFALIVIGLWTGAIILETVFNWPGLGRTLFQAVGLYDTPIIVGSTIIYSYLLAVTVFLLDFVYALVDPRVRIGSEGTRAS